MVAIDTILEHILEATIQITWNRVLQTIFSNWITFLWMLKAGYRGTVPVKRITRILISVYLIRNRIGKLGKSKINIRLIDLKLFVPANR